MELASYSPEDVIILVAGVVPITGLAEGTFVSLRRPEVVFKTHVSSDGVVSRNYINNPIFELELTLHSASDSNGILSKLHMLDTKTVRGDLPILVKDATGSSLFFSSSAWVSELPAMDFSTEITDRIWKFTCVGETYNFGGNTGDPSILGDLANAAIGLVPSLTRFF